MRRFIHAIVTVIANRNRNGHTVVTGMDQVCADRSLLPRVCAGSALGKWTDLFCMKHPFMQAALERLHQYQPRAAAVPASLLPRRSERNSSPLAFALRK